MVPPVRALHVALSWLTIAPLPQPAGPMDRRIGGAVIAATPVVGALLGALVAGLAVGLSHTDLPDSLIGVLVVIALAVATRGMHLDGLADTADGLGCYGPPDRVAEVMRSGGVGPFGAATLVVVLALQWTAFSTLIADNRWYELGFAIALGRVAAVVGTRAGLPAAHSTGFGTLVAGTQRTSIVVWIVIAALAAVATGLPGLGATTASDFAAGDAISAVLVVAVVVIASWWFTRHCARRIGGVTGDVLGAAIEGGVAIAVVGLLV